MLAGLKIVGVSILAAVCFGIVHDSVTVRICVEYFTVFHPRLAWLGESPNKLALYWGIVATWWMGFGLGVPLAVFALWGVRPPLFAKDLLHPLAKLLAIMAACSLVMGVTGYLLCAAGVVQPQEPWATRIPSEKHALFLADLWAHSSSYAVGGIGGVLLWGWCVHTRIQRAKTGNDV